MDIDNSFQLAVDYYQNGNFHQAESLCRQIISEQHNHVDALNLLGLVCYCLSNYDHAIHCITSALELNPINAEAYINLGNAFRAKGQPDQAITFYEKAINLNLNIAMPYNNIGSVLQEKGQLDEAISYYQKALHYDPYLSFAYHNMGAALQEKKQLDEAISYYQKAVKLNPNFADTYNNLGIIFQKKGQLDEAISCYQKVIELNPKKADIYFNLGNVLKGKGKIDEAIIHYQKAVQLNPDYVVAYYNLGKIYQDANKLDQAKSYYQKAVLINPGYVEAYINLGAVLKEQGKIDEAITCYQKAVQFNPDYVVAYYNLANIFQDANKLDQAVFYYQKAILINPNYVKAYNNLGNVLKGKGNVNEAEEYYRTALEIKPDSVIHSNLLLTLNYNPLYDAQTIFSEHLRFAKQYTESLSSAIAPHSNERSPHRNLKIGYVSPDFRKHPVSSFIEAVLTEHNKGHFEVFCYSNNSGHDKVTKRIQEQTDKWRSIVGMSDEEATELIRKDKIDILVDLAGHTAYNRILIFARKPAPIQISWIGYLATTGLSTIDYKITDTYADPPGKTEQFYTEKLLRLPESFLCYLPDRVSPAVGSLPVLLKKHITFGSFNNFAKVTPDVFSLWAKILNTVEDSHLIMKWKGFSDKTTSQYAMNMFTKKNINADRITLQSWDPSPKYLEAYNLIDIGLDTFPFNGATTTCEALWMGVPVITLSGSAYHSRSGVSLLSNVGLPELVANTADEYISIAVNLAKDLKRLGSLHEHLRNMMECSPLCNAKRFTENLEMCYRKIWETWCKSQM
jgi:protein O-GlcNAc transferase